MGYIYIIRNYINEKVYIGQTTKNIEDRWKQHLYNAINSKTRNQALYLAMRKYGVENFYIEELENVCDDLSLDDKEIYYIKEFNSLAPNGYNETLGGSKFKDDNPMYHDEIRTKVSKHFIGDKNPAKRPEVREKIRKSRLGTKASDETKKKMSQNNGRYWLGKNLSKETRDKISKNHGCRGKFGGLNPNAKQVARIDKDSFEILETYDSISSAIKWVQSNVKEGASQIGISHCCGGHQKTAFGYIWKFI